MQTPKAQGVGGQGKRLGPVAASVGSNGGRWGHRGTPALRLPAASSSRPKEELLLGAAGARRRRERAVGDTRPSRCGWVEQRLPSKRRHRWVNEVTGQPISSSLVSLCLGRCKNVGSGRGGGKELVTGLQIL